MMPGLITQYVLKLHSRCDLACDHCYVYKQADQSWRGKPQAMSQEIATLAAMRVAEHLTTHQLAHVRIVLHGGEPLLIGTDRMRMVLAALEAQIRPVAEIDIRIHTNGVLLDEQWCALFDEYDVKVGVSLDGDQASNDRHRRFANGASSHQQVKRALSLLRRPEHRHLYAGILCTIDLDNDPIAVYEALLAEKPPNLDLLLPHATWEHPPPRTTGLAEPYALWLIRIHQRWVNDGRPVPIRLFDSLRSAARGGPSWSESVGLEPVDLLVIETDGSWEQPDSLKAAYDGAPATGLHVFSHAVDEVVRLPGFVARQGGANTLSRTCQACQVVRICGGGLYAHRYRAETGFDNPSVYCDDLKALIGHLSVERVRPETVITPRARHVLTDSAFNKLAAGPGDGDAVRSLADMRLSMTRALVATVAAQTDDWHDDALKGAMTEGWALLCALDREHPDAVRETFAHPYVHAWAIRCLRPPADADPDLDRAHLAGLAVAAAIRAKATAQLPVPVRDSNLYVPTVGVLQIDGGPVRSAVVSVTPDHLAIPGQDVRWQWTRQVTGESLQIAIEDLDPFRDCQEWPAADRLTIAEWDAWRHGLASAGSRLAVTVPEYAQAMSAGLRTVVPLRRGRTGNRSATSRHAFGALALALPSQPDGLDALLLHEFQHVKLHALIDMHDLFDVEDSRRLPVPWRPDPRPVEGILHGAYAYLALAHLCRSRGPAALGQHQQYQSWVRGAIDMLAGQSVLTSDGERFATGMYTAAQAHADDQ